MRPARRNHRETILRRVDHAVENHRPLHLDHLRNGGIEIGGLLAADADRVIGLGKLDEIRQGRGVALRIAPAMQQLLPLPHHPHVLVVEDEDLDRQPVLHGGRHLLHGHQHRGFAGNVDDERIRVGHLHPDRSRQPVAHGAEAARGHPAVRLLKAEELRRPHLVLAHFGGDVDVAIAGRRIEPLDGVLRLDDVVGRPVGERLSAPPFFDLAPPCLQRAAVRRRAHVVAHDPDIDLNVLVDRGRVDVDVDFARMRREGVEAPGDAVVEPRPDAGHDVAIVHGEVCLVGAVHAEHAEPLRVGGRHRAEPHKGRGHRKAGEAEELAQQPRRGRPGIDDAAAGVEQRTLRRRHQGDGRLDLVAVAVELRPVTPVRKFVRPCVGAGGELDVLGDIDHHGAGPPARGHIERLVQHARQVGDVLDQVIVLGAGPGDADRIALLEGVVADHVGRHLAGDAHERD